MDHCWSLEQLSLLFMICGGWCMPTVANLDLDLRIAFGHILDPPDDFRHAVDKRSASSR